MQFIKARLLNLIMMCQLVLVVSGCQVGFPLFAPIPELPADLQLVVNDAEMFISAEENPLNMVIPGTPIEDLTTKLPGCWGAVQPQGFFPLPFVGELQFQLYEVIRFEPEASTVLMEQLLLVHLPDGAAEPAVALSHSGSYELVGDGLVVLTLARIEGIDPFSGEVSVPDETSSLPMKVWALVTVSGDWMAYSPGAEPPDGLAGAAEIRVFRRFECP